MNLPADSLHIVDICDFALIEDFNRNLEPNTMSKRALARELSRLSAALTYLLASQYVNAFLNFSKGSLTERFSDPV